MLEAVLFFTALLCVFEFAVICMMPRVPRLFMLGSRAGRTGMHMLVFSLNLWIHWGTVTGTMAATAAFVVSLITVQVARLVFGQLKDGVYQRGLINYAREMQQ